MKLDLIYTKRKYEHRLFFDLVYEWEDILMKELNLKPLNYDEEWSRWGGYKLLKYRTMRWLTKRSKILRSCIIPQKNGLKFDMWTHGAPRLNAEHIIPWVIDFFMEEKDFVGLNENYRQYPVVFISSNEVFNLLKTSVVVKDVNIRHVALSISDIYKINKNTKFAKEYDVVLLGRQNPVLLKYFRQYVSTHPQVSYVYRKLDDSHYGEEKLYHYYSVCNGVESFIGDITEREQFISLTRKGRIGLYATPDIDTNHERAHGYNQVTPRFLEFIASGAHVIARYVPNPDTDYYRLQDFSKPIETYEQFEEAMDYALTHEVDMAKYASYLALHYTSVRAKEIKQIMSEL